MATSEVLRRRLRETPTTDIMPIPGASDLCARMTAERVPALLAICWEREGFECAQPRLTEVSPDFLKITCVVCKGDVCTRKRVIAAIATERLYGLDYAEVALPDILQLRSASWRLQQRLLLQPTGVAVMFLVALLGVLSFFGERVAATGSMMPRLLELVPGGASGGQIIFVLTLAAHVVEGGIAFVTCRRLGLGALATWSWTWPVLLCGFPCLRWIRVLEAEAARCAKADKRS